MKQWREEDGKLTPAISDSTIWIQGLKAIVYAAPGFESSSEPWCCRCSSVIINEVLIWMPYDSGKQDICVVKGYFPK